MKADDFVKNWSKVLPFSYVDMFKKELQEVFEEELPKAVLELKKREDKTPKEVKSNDALIRMECLKLAYKTLRRRMVSSKMEDLVNLSDEYVKYVKTGKYDIGTV